jgi:hypothetical protein
VPAAAPSERKEDVENALAKLDLVLRWHLDDVRGPFPDGPVLLCEKSGDQKRGSLCHPTTLNTGPLRRPCGTCACRKPSSKMSTSARSRQRWVS